MAPRFILVPMESSTQFDPLVALDFYVRQHDLWATIRHRIAIGARASGSVFACSDSLRHIPFMKALLQMGSTVCPRATRIAISYQ